MAKSTSEINYIGIEMQISVVSIALDKLIEQDIPNVQLLHVDGSALTNYFADHEVDQIYLNFFRSLAKKKHEKRRLTSKAFWQSMNKFYVRMVKFISKRTIKAYLNIHSPAFHNMVWF